jgi:hypothetical protein
VDVEIEAAVDCLQRRLHIEHRAHWSNYTLPNLKKFWEGLKSSPSTAKFSPSPPPIRRVFREAADQAQCDRSSIRAETNSPWPNPGITPRNAKGPTVSCRALWYLVGPAGFEPATNRLKVRSSGVCANPYDARSAHLAQPKTPRKRGILIQISPIFSKIAHLREMAIVLANHTNPVYCPQSVARNKRMTTSFVAYA